jgi:hypothetical protein
MNLTPQYLAVLDFLGRRDPREFRFRRKESGVSHSQGPEDVALDERIQPLRGHPLHDLAEKNEVQITVGEGPAGRRQRLFSSGKLDSLLISQPIGLDQSRPQSGRVGEEMTHRDGVATISPELLDVARDRGVEVHFPLLDEHHDRRSRGHDLGQRRHIKNGVEGQRFRRRNAGAAAIHIAIDVAVALDPEDSADDLVLVDGALNGRVNLPQARGGERVGNGS